MKKVIIVTGAASGLGLEICRKLSAEGYLVAAVGRKPSEDLSRLLDHENSSVKYFEFDFENVNLIQGLVRQITKELGAVYGLVNNAAIGHDGVLATMHETEIKDLINVNVTAPITLTKYVSRSMLRRQEGRIVNIGSIIASTGFNGLSVYAATKAALSGFTKSLSRELGKAKITVNTVAPGYMATKMTQGLTGEKLKSIERRSPLGELVTPESVASTVSYLLSNDARLITGATFTIDAGSTA